MDGVGRIIGEGDPRRDAEGAPARKRDSLLLIAQLKLSDRPDPLDVRVRNLSPGGLMIELDHLLDTGTAVTLELRGLGEVRGTVAWYTRGRAGIALSTPIDPQRVRKPVGTGRSTPVYANPLLVAPRPRRG